MRLGVLGHGVVGSAFVDLVAARAGEVRARAGVDLRVTRVAVRDHGRHRGLPAGLAVTDPHAVVDDPEVEIGRAHV